MSENFIQDLNEYFSKKYANYDLICSVPSYESVTVSMLLKNRNRIEEGEIVSNETRKIAYQPQAEKVLAEVKERYVDNNFTFSVRVAPTKTRMKTMFGITGITGKAVAGTISRYGEDPAKYGEKLGLTEDVWKKVLKGFYIPEKVLIYKMTILLGLSQKDNFDLMKACGYVYDFADARDVVMRYILDYRLFNRDMVRAAFEEFHIRKIVD